MSRTLSLRAAVIALAIGLVFCSFGFVRAQAAAQVVICAPSSGTNVYFAGGTFPHASCKTGDATISLTGPQGPAGVNGKSAFEIAQSNGFSGNVNAWLASLVGPKGDKGDTGATGPQGPAGTSNILSGVLSTGSDIIVPPATVTTTTVGTSTQTNITALGTVTMTVAVLGCLSGTLPPHILMQAQNLPPNVWLQNARCNGSTMASITLVNAESDASVTVPAGTKFTYIIL